MRAIEKTPGAAFTLATALALAFGVELEVGLGVEGAAIDCVVIRSAAPATSVNDNAAFMDFEVMDVFTRVF